MQIKPHLSARFTSSAARIAALGAVAVLFAGSPTRATQNDPFPSPLESIQVAPGEGSTFHNRLDQGELYLLKANGDAVSGGDGPGIDIEPKTLRPALGAGATRMIWTASDRKSHTYYMIVNGSGGPLSLKRTPPARLLAGASPDGDAMTVSLYRLSALPAPLETLQVPLLQKIVPTVMATRKSAVYLLQAIGQGRVGGGGLGQGDAEYMDYDASGAGQVDVGDGNTDYGLGVDESDLAKSPHAHWWGPWRQDHVYDMLFTGTGKPISFMFYDVAGGYGDNSPTDTLTVKVYALP
ncbi:hypothetical protein CCAX7_58080 [Capsulimonas corticalis]|uniref:Uncharacterized protein n=1 Tax=Capsulimonas corticalis TaxID=2219043 RepID=A0A402D031_9BACT|nr:hypothetical protein [Capsulimonas corticalis]BDI33757.1 hypothetical protein CCAX7_58080 [Capsulimonas corticalis]